MGEVNVTNGSDVMKPQTSPGWDEEATPESGLSTRNKKVIRKGIRKDCFIGKTEPSEEDCHFGTTC